MQKSLCKQKCNWLNYLIRQLEARLMNRVARWVSPKYRTVSVEQNIELFAQYHFYTKQRAKIPDSPIHSLFHYRHLYSAFSSGATQRRLNTGYQATLLMKPFYGQLEAGAMINRCH